MIISLKIEMRKYKAVFGINYGLRLSSRVKYPDYIERQEEFMAGHSAEAYRRAMDMAKLFSAQYSPNPATFFTKVSLLSLLNMEENIGFNFSKSIVRRNLVGMIIDNP